MFAIHHVHVARIRMISAPSEHGIQRGRILASYPYNADVLGPRSPPTTEDHHPALWSRAVYLYQIGQASISGKDGIILGAPCP